MMRKKSILILNRRYKIHIIIYFTIFLAGATSGAIELDGDRQGDHNYTISGSKCSSMPFNLLFNSKINIHICKLPYSPFLQIETFGHLDKIIA
ncbi:MAG: hypothetical protein LBG46_03290 [Elusimicrobiota bacterium]|nr:hypothetical protein [Elusimicrobiota bacterium]